MNDSSPKKCNNLTGKEWLQNSFSIWRGLIKTQSEKAYKHPASFPVSLVEKLLHTFSKTPCHVLDPFNGIGSTTSAAENLKCKAVGIDLSSDYCNIAKSRLINLDTAIQIINGDCIKELDNLESNCFDICITSPPYWDILNMKRSADKKQVIKYSNQTIDLGNIDNYDEFLQQLSLVFSKVHRVLKNNGYCIINVMDLRKKSNFYPLHSDLATVMTKIGFIYDDLIIWDRQSDYNNMKPLGYPTKFRINKVHEYLLIFVKK